MSDETKSASVDEFVEKTRVIGEDARRVADDVRDLYSTATRRVDLGAMYRENPLLVLGIAAGVGYVLGGGLFTPFTAKLVKYGTRALVVPVLSSQIKDAMPEE